MSLPLPRLDDRAYEDLVEEARALVPTLYPEWTDHNPADPGITLIELFAWLAEMLTYRADQLTEAQNHTFLKLLNGPQWQGRGDLDEDLQATVTALRQRYRAVTAEDYEELARAASADVERAWCVPRRNLAAASEGERQAVAPGHVSVILLPAAAAADPASEAGAPVPSQALLDSVWQFLEPRRLLTTRHHLSGPTYVPVAAEVVFARRPDAPAGEVHARVLAALSDFLDPLAGGPRGNGWPLGRDVYVSELYQVLEDVEGVEHVSDVALASECPAGAAHCEEAAALWHDNGDLIGLALAAHQLPWTLVDPGAIVSAEALVPVRLTVTVSPATPFTEAQARRQIKEAIRRHFHPLYGGADGSQAWETTHDAILTAVLSLDEVAAVGEILVLAPPGRFADETLRLAGGELADVATTVEIA